MTGVWRAIGWTALFGAVIVGFELWSPGLAWLLLQAVVRMVWLSVQALVWPAAALGLFLWGRRVGYLSGQRDAYQRVASKAGLWRRS